MKAKKTATRIGHFLSELNQSGPTFTLVVARGGNASQREFYIGKFRLDWRADGTSIPMDLPDGQYRLSWYVRGNPGQSFSFRLLQPRDEPMDVGSLAGYGSYMSDAVRDLA